MTIRKAFSNLAVCSSLPEAEALGVLSQPVELGAEPKSVIQIVPLGSFVYQNPAFNKGKAVHFDITPAVVAQLIAAKEPADLVVDYEHQCLGSGEAPASGWIKELIDGGERGLLGRVEWTPRAATMIAAKEYRYVSPTILKGVPSKTEAGKLIPYKLHSVALVNAPYLGGIEPVAAKQATTMEDGTMNKFKQWLASLGIKLDDNATEDQLVATCKTMIAAIVTATGIPADTATLEGITTGIAALKQQATNDGVALIAQLRSDLGLKADATASEITGHIAALKQGHAAHGDLAAEVAALKADAAAQKALKAVDAAVLSGKVTPGTKDSMLAWAQKDLVAFEAFVAKAPVVVAPSAVSPGAKEPSGPATQLDADQMAVCKAMGLDQAAYLKTLNGLDAE
jgi:phage I-like protein